MLTKDELLNQSVVYLRDNSVLTIVEVNDFANVGDARITFDNGKTFILRLSVSNNAIKFADETLQKKVLEEIETFWTHFYTFDFILMMF